MQMIEAIIKPNRLDAVKDALNRVGILGATAVEVKGYGRQGGHTERYRGATLEIRFVPKVMLQVAVKDAELDMALKAIIDAARTGEVGDGKIFVYPISQTIRIRTNDRGDEAL